ncbi:hypothetical protein REPUB_Repub06bG0141900 [Reevesia pubescens]
MVKLRSSFWIKALNVDFSGFDSIWWFSLGACAPSSHPAFQRTYVTWLSAPFGSLKFNIDCSSKGNLGLSCCEGVLRNDVGSICAIFSRLLGLVDVVTSELFSLYHALDLFSKSEWKNKSHLIIEFDSKFVVDWCTNKDGKPWTFWNSFLKIDFIWKS